MRSTDELLRSEASEASAPELTPELVSDAMLRNVQTLPPEATVADARRSFGDHVHMLLVTRGDQLLGTLLRGDLPSSDDDAPCLQHARLDGRCCSPAELVEPIRRRMLRRGERRLAVVDDTGALLGLLCLKHHGAGFCSKSDVDARRCADAQSSRS
jgi:CBS domain-containing protein